MALTSRWVLRQTCQRLYGGSVAFSVPSPGVINNRRANVATLAVCNVPFGTAAQVPGCSPACRPSATARSRPAAARVWISTQRLAYDQLQTGPGVIDRAHLDIDQT